MPRAQTKSPENEMHASPALLSLMQSGFVEHQLWDPNILGSSKQLKIGDYPFFTWILALFAPFILSFVTHERGPTAAVFIPRTQSSPPAELSTALHMTLLLSSTAFTTLHVSIQPCSPSTHHHFQFTCILYCKSNLFPFLSLVLLPHTHLSGFPGCASR